MQENDESSSEKTIIVGDEEINHILKKYGSGEHNSPSAPTSRGLDKHFYSLDEFSDGEFNYEPLENRIKGQSSKTRSWQEKFSTADFCEDSNDFDAVLKRISQLEGEQFHNQPRPSVSREIEALIVGNIIEKPKPQYKSPDSDEIISLGSESSDHRSEEFDLNVIELEKIKNNAKSELPEGRLVTTDNSSLDLSSENLIGEPKPKKCRKKSICDIKTQQAKKKLAKAREREQKQLEKEHQKQLKNALKIVENCVKPDRCIQYLTVNIDDNISDKHYGEVIKAGLKSGGYNYKVSKQTVPNMITWTRKVPTIQNMLLQEVDQQEKHYLLIMDVPEFIQHIVDDTLTGHIQSLLSMPQIKHLSIAILRLQGYYKYLRDKKNREFKEAVSEIDKRKRTDIEFKGLSKVHKKDIDRKLVELQIFCKNIYIRPVEKFEDLAIFIGECTKSVAQIPYKLAKAESLQQENEFFTVNNRDCVNVDKDGNGLSRLWHQFLRMFPLASLETAESITAVYPTMHSLLEAYKSCKKPEDGEKLLQGLPVRRAVGPLGGQRKLGPELSKKAYRFFCSEDNVLL